MFIWKSTLKKWLAEMLGKEIGEIPALLKEAKDLIGPVADVSQVKRELAELRLQKDIELRDIEHLVRIKEAKLDIEHDKKTLELKNEFKDQEMALQTEYHDKVLAQLNEAKKDMNGMYREIMKRLPNVSARLEVKN